MGRGRVQLKRIENKISRQVTFSKRKTGLSKKAHEISVLCDADVALIIFSSQGKLFEYSSHSSSVETILQRYESYSYAEKMLTATGSESQGSWTFEFSKLKAKIEVLEKNIRHYVGEDLGPLSLRELQSVEQQLDTALKRIRTRKNQLINESISDLQKKGKSLQEQNNSLSKKLKENEKIIAQHAQQEQQNLGLNSSTTLLPQPPPQPRQSLPSLTISDTYQAEAAIGVEDGTQTRPTSNALMPPWMHSHMNQ